MGLVIKDDKWRIPDELWERIVPLLPDPPPHPLGCHRPRVPDRDAMNGILALDATGIVSCSAAHRRFREWEAAGVFARFWRQGLIRSRGGDRLGVPGDGRCDDQGSAGRGKNRPGSHRQSQVGHETKRPVRRRRSTAVGAT